MEQERSKGDQLVTKIAHERAEDLAARRIQAFFKQVLVDVECKYMLPFFVCVSRCVCCYSFALLCFVCCVTSAPTVKDAKKGAKLAMGALSRFGSKAGLDFTGKASRASMSSLVAPLAAAAPTKPPPHVRGFLYKKGFTGLKKWQVINKPLVGRHMFLTVTCVLPLALSHDDDSAATMCFARATCRFGAARRSMMLASHQHRDLLSLYLDTGCKRYHARSGFFLQQHAANMHVLFVLLWILQEKNELKFSLVPKDKTDKYSCVEVDTEGFADVAEPVKMPKPKYSFQFKAVSPSARRAWCAVSRRFLMLVSPLKPATHILCVYCVARLCMMQEM